MSTELANCFWTASSVLIKTLLIATSILSMDSWFALRKRSLEAPVILARIWTAPFSSLKCGTVTLPPAFMSTSGLRLPMLLMCFKPKARSALKPLS